jgi:hypothetical protein
MMQSIQSIESRLDSMLTVLQSSNRQAGDDDKIILRHRIALAVTRATFSGDSKWFAYVTTYTLCVKILKMSTITSAEPILLTVDIIPEKNYDDREKSIHCMAFTTDGSCLCVGVGGDLFDNYMLEFHVIRLPLDREGIHTKMIKVDALQVETKSPYEDPNDNFPLSVAKCRNNVFFFLNQDNLCLVNEKFFTDNSQSQSDPTPVGKQMQSKGQATAICKKGYTVCDGQDFVACLNDSGISVYSFSPTEKGVNLTLFHTIHMDIGIELGMGIIMNPRYIVFYTDDRHAFHVYRKTDDSKNWVPHLTNSTESGIDGKLFFNPKESSYLYAVKGKKCWRLDLDKNQPILVYGRFANAVDKDYDDFIHKVVYSSDYTAVCTLGMVTFYDDRTVRQGMAWTRRDVRDSGQGSGWANRSAQRR